MAMPDFVLRKDNQTLIVEVKAYRSQSIGVGTLEQAMFQLARYRAALAETAEYQAAQMCLAIFGAVDPSVKDAFAKQHEMHVLDVTNLLYLTRENTELSRLLAETLPYPSDALQSAPPDSFLTDFFSVAATAPETGGMDERDETDKLIERLKACKTGKRNKADRIYEALCDDVVAHLFAPEFSKMKRQLVTADKLFRMDLLCALKGLTAFWQFLRTYYNTNFIVFEYKNYGDKLSQNLIYVTEKYLFDAALRNVAIIFSRKGFDDGAKSAAMGCLKENKKLIIGLNDEDVFEMLRLKKEGDEPSDYLLSKLEDYLMAIGK